MDRLYACPLHTQILPSVAFQQQERTAGTVGLSAWFLSYDSKAFFPTQGCWHPQNKKTAIKKLQNGSITLSCWLPQNSFESLEKRFLYLTTTSLLAAEEGLSRNCSPATSGTGSSSGLIGCIICYDGKLHEM